jgi:hypothetical protein
MRSRAVAPEVGRHIFFRPSNRLLQVQPSGDRIIGSVALGFFRFLEGIEIHRSNGAALGNRPTQDFHSPGFPILERERFLTGKHIGV